MYLENNEHLCEFDIGLRSFYVRNLNWAPALSYAVGMGGGELGQINGEALRNEQVWALEKRKLKAVEVSCAVWDTHSAETRVSIHTWKAF